LVKTSAILCLEETWKVHRMPNWSFSRTTWQSMSICFVRSW
jgi:hypothetical protein